MPKDRKNPRTANGSLRQKHRLRLKAQGGPCKICNGKLGPIHYDEPADGKHPLAFVIDEIRPISLYARFGYSSAREAAEDWENLQAAHYYCNAMKSNKIGFSIGQGQEPELGMRKLINVKDGQW